MGFNTWSTFGIVVDRGRWEIYGTYKTPTGSGKTDSFSVSAEQIEALDHLSIIQDYRYPETFYAGKWDNVTITVDGGTSAAIHDAFDYPDGNLAGSGAWRAVDNAVVSIRDGIVDGETRLASTLLLLDADWKVQHRVGGTERHSFVGHFRRRPMGRCRLQRRIGRSLGDQHSRVAHVCVHSRGPAGACRLLTH